MCEFTKISPKFTLSSFDFDFQQKSRHFFVYGIYQILVQKVAFNRFSGHFVAYNRENRL